MGFIRVVTTVVMGLLLQFLIGGEACEGPKKIGCFYLGTNSEKYGTLYPEDIDAFICSHITYAHGFMDNSTISLKPIHFKWNVTGDGLVPRLVKLKDTYSDLKLILNIHGINLRMLRKPVEREIVINNAVQWLRENGFDGLKFLFFMGRYYREDFADLLCDMKSEFDKHGYQLSVMILDRRFSDPSPGQEGVLSKVGRCCDYITLLVDTKMNEPLPSIEENRSNVDWFIERGLPANKIKIAVPTSGTYVTEDKNGTLNNANRRIKVDQDLQDGHAIRYREILNLLNDSSLEWNITRDEVTKKMHASTPSGFSMSFEDPESIAFQANYVLKKGLYGIEIVSLDMDDREDIDGKGTFPMIRTVYNVFRTQNRSTDCNP